MVSQSKNSHFGSELIPINKRFFSLSVALVLLILLASGLQAGPKVRLVPMDFLGGFGPGKMCQKRFEAISDGTIAPPRVPSGGALVKVDRGSYELYLYIFCDPSLNRLVIFQEERTFGERYPTRVREYGKFFRATHHENLDNMTDSLGNPIPSEGIFGAPIDVAVSSCGAFYEPDRDFIFVLDRDYHKIVRLRYDVSLDSLIWVDTFGGDSLRFPTSMEYADYGDNDTTNDKIFVPDVERHNFVRFSREGACEIIFPFDDGGFFGMAYPSGVAVTSRKSSRNYLYICDAKLPKIMQLSSVYSKRIDFETNEYFKEAPPPPNLAAIDADWQGNVYIANNSQHSIIAMTDTLPTSYTIFGPVQMGAGRLWYPTDIHIDGDEMQVCELWGDTTGIASYKIIPDSALPVIERIPRQNHLYAATPSYFTGQTKIPFDVSIFGQVELSILDKSGETVKTLLNTNVPAGNQAVVWDGRNESGEYVEEGIYLIKMIASDYQASKVVLYLR
jgi:hypothetical protein